MLRQWFISLRKPVLIVSSTLLIGSLFLVNIFLERTLLHSAKNRVTILSEKLRSFSNEIQLQEYLSANPSLAFLGITLLDANQKIIYRSLSGEKFLFERRPEIQIAVHYGHGMVERYSDNLHQIILFIAQRFISHDREYILCVEMPFSEIRLVTRSFTLGLIILSSVILVLLVGVTSRMLISITRPMQKMIDMIRSFQQGKESGMLRIEMNGKMGAENEFSQLAQMINHLSERIQTQITHLIRQKEKTQGILESLGEGVIAIEMDRSVAYVNRTAIKMLGIIENQSSPRQFSEIQASRSELFQQCAQLVECVFDKGQKVSQSFVVEETRRLYFDLTAFLLTQHSGVILVIQDKTADHEIVEMGKDFVANASHELRTPITIIRGFAETLYEVDSLSTEQKKEIIQKILKTSLRLDLLVKSLQQLSDLENGCDKSFCAIDMPQLIDQCLRQLLALHPSTEVETEHHPFIQSIWAEPHLLTMALMNLLENAVKYSPSPAQIAIRTSQEGSFFQIAVTDRGIGMPQSDIPRIFNRFYTVDKARSRKFGGSGLGLSIVKAIVEKHCGTVSVSSRLGIGSTFYLCLPIHDGKNKLVFKQTSESSSINV